MSAPAYYPLSPLKSSLKGANSPVHMDHSFRDSSYSPRVTFSSGADDRPATGLTTFLTLLRPQLYRKHQPHHRPSWDALKTPLEMALPPFAAIGYLAFCYTVHGKVVSVDPYGLVTVTPQHLSTIKGGITAISIMVISIALFPVYTIVSQLKSEEFFRILTSRNQGVPLEAINNVSTPSFSTLDMLIAVWRKTCSDHYILGIVTSFLVLVVTTLAPGALTIETVLSDGELMAFSIGAVSAQSVLNGTYNGIPALHASLNSEKAAYVAWAEMELDVQYSFGTANSSDPDYVAFIAPLPLNLDTTTIARWVTDVIGLNPSCSWASTNITGTLQVPVNSTSDFGAYIATAYLPDFNLDVQIVPDDIPLTADTPFATIKDPTSAVTNHTTQAPASDGSTVFLLGQCESGCSPGTLVNITLDLSGISNTFTIALTDQVWTMAVLACVPNITIETRVVRNDGHGVLSIQPLLEGGWLWPQGNLHPIQTTALFSIATMSVGQYAGPLSGSQASYRQLGSQVQGDILYGKAQFENLPGIDSLTGTTVTITPASIKDITQGYTQLLESTSKSYLAGYLGTAYVPGRLSTTIVVFAAAIPNLVISTVVFSLLAAVIVVAHLRPGQGVEFTLVNVAAAVHGSELPAQFAQMKSERSACACAALEEAAVDLDSDMESNPGKDLSTAAGDVPVDEEDIVKMLGQRRIFMQTRADGSSVLHIS